MSARSGLSLGVVVQTKTMQTVRVVVDKVINFEMVCWLTWTLDGYLIKSNLVNAMGAPPVKNSMTPRQAIKFRMWHK